MHSVLLGLGYKACMMHLNNIVIGQKFQENLDILCKEFWKFQEARLKLDLQSDNYSVEGTVPGECHNTGSTHYNPREAEDCVGVADTEKQTSRGHSPVYVLLQDVHPWIY